MSKPPLKKTIQVFLGAIATATMFLENKSLSPYLDYLNNAPTMSSDSFFSLFSSSPSNDDNSGDKNDNKQQVEMNYTRGFVKFVPANNDMANDFPTPVFLGCNERNFCKMSNVCYSNNDNMLIFDTPHGNTLTWWFAPHASWGGYTVPRRGRVLPREVYSKFQNVYFTKR